MLQKNTRGNWRVAITALLLALVLVTGAGNARAQSTFGSMRGTVTDLSGAVVEGATVTLHSLDDGADRQTTTNGSGEFLLENLNAGHYKVTVHYDGFTDAVIAATLDARQEQRLPVTRSVASRSPDSRSPPAW